MFCDRRHESIRSSLPSALHRMSGENSRSTLYRKRKNSITCMPHAKVVGDSTAPRSIPHRCFLQVLARIRWIPLQPQSSIAVRLWCMKNSVKTPSHLRQAHQPLLRPPVWQMSRPLRRRYCVAASSVSENSKLEADKVWQFD